MSKRTSSAAATRRSASSEVAETPNRKRKRVEKDPKASHLYTDDNPETTLHGTGFKDAATARHTIELVSKRSLTYQFQTINTMLYRAKGQKNKTLGIEAAIPILQDWVDSYKARKAALRSLPLLSKPKVKAYLEGYDSGQFEIESDLALRDAEAFARIYIDLPTRKRLANQLVDMKHPEREDWEVRRYNKLCTLMPEDVSDAAPMWTDERAGKPTREHLTMILWAFSPCKKV